MNKSIYTKKHKELCRLLIEKRKDANLTQEVLADKLGRPQSFVAKYEGGERRLDIIEFIEIAEAIKFDPSKFIRELTSKRVT